MRCCHPFMLLAVLLATFALIQATTDPKQSAPTDREEDNFLDESPVNKVSVLKTGERKQQRTAGILNSLMADPTVPVFLVMGLATLASTILTAGLDKLDRDSENEIHSRRRRSISSPGWSDQVLEVLRSVEEAVHKYQDFESQVLNDLNKPID